MENQVRCGQLRQRALQGSRGEPDSANAGKSNRTNPARRELLGTSRQSRKSCGVRLPIAKRASLLRFARFLFCPAQLKYSGEEDLRVSHPWFRTGIPFTFPVSRCFIPGRVWSLPRPGRGIFLLRVSSASSASPRYTFI